jgi:hypothetical protein
MRKRWIGFAVPCFTLWAISFLAAEAGSAGLVTTLRIAGSLLVVGAWALIFMYGPRRLLLSPLTHLAAFALLFYGWFSALSLVVMDLNLDADYYATRNSFAYIAVHVGSRSELIIIGFAGLCLAAFALTAAFLPDNHESSVEGLGNRLPRAFAWGTTLVLLCVIVVLIASTTPELAAVTGTRAGKEVVAAIPVIFSFLAAVVVVTSTRQRPGQLFLGSAAVAGGIFVLVFVNRAQMPLLAAYSLALVVAVSMAPSPRRVIAIAMCSAALLAAVLVILVQVRPQHDTILPVGPGHRVLTMVEQKFLKRQGMSAGCFSRIADIGFSRNDHGNPFYFVTSVVPRALWPGKPNLSRGSEFAELCGQNGSMESGHSESITILGEPILEAGYRGLLAAEVTLVVLLAAVTWFGLTGGPVRLIVLSALMPWLIAVEHPFALYIANAVKMALIVLPFALALHWFLHRSRHSFPGHSDDAAPSARIG